MNPIAFRSFFLACFTACTAGASDVPLGAQYPRLRHIMEGGPPSFLGPIDNGLGCRCRIGVTVEGT